MRTLEERLAAPEPEPWIPEEGESVFGEVEEITNRETDYGIKPFVTIITDEGEALSVACWDTVAYGKIKDLDPQPGDQIGFKFLGKQVPKSGGKPYNNWRIVLTRAARPAVDVEHPSFDEPED